MIPPATALRSGSGDHNYDGRAVRHGNSVMLTKPDGSRLKFDFVNQGNTSFVYHKRRLEAKVIRNGGTTTVYDVIARLSS
jgi:hypothetical protein